MTLDPHEEAVYRHRAKQLDRLAHRRDTFGLWLGYAIVALSVFVVVYSVVRWWL